MHALCGEGSRRFVVSSAGLQTWFCWLVKVSSVRMWHEFTKPNVRSVLAKFVRLMFRKLSFVFCWWHICLRLRLRLVGMFWHVPKLRCKLDGTWRIVRAHFARMCFLFFSRLFQYELDCWQQLENRCIVLILTSNWMLTRRCCEFLECVRAVTTKR